MCSKIKRPRASNAGRAARVIINLSWLCSSSGSTEEPLGPVWESVYSNNSAHWGSKGPEVNGLKQIKLLKDQIRAVCWKMVLRGGVLLLYLEATLRCRECGNSLVASPFLSVSSCELHFQDPEFVHSKTRVLNFLGNYPSSTCINNNPSYRKCC